VGLRCRIPPKHLDQLKAPAIRLTYTLNLFQGKTTDINKPDSKEVVKCEVGKISNLLGTGSRQNSTIKSGFTNMFFMSQLKRQIFHFSVGIVMQVSVEQKVNWIL
jgi:hypothetical protein